MLPKKNRVTTKDFRGVLKAGRVYHSPHFYLRSIPSGTDTQGQFSVVVSKKVAPGAVERNVLRRKLYGMLELHLKNFKKSEKTLIYLKEDIRKISRKSTMDELNDLLHRAGLLS